MQMMIECPNVLLGELSVPAAMSGIGARMEAVEDEPAGPWLGVFLDSIDVTKLTEWDLPAYLRLSAKHQAWATSLTADGVAEIASRPGGFGADKEVALALREPVGAAQRRIWVAQRLRRLPTLRRLFRAGMVSGKHRSGDRAAGGDRPDGRRRRREAAAARHRRGNWPAPASRPRCLPADARADRADPRRVRPLRRAGQSGPGQPHRYRPRHRTSRRPHGHRQPDPQRPDLARGHTKKQLAVTVDGSGSVSWTSVLGQSRSVNPYDYRLEEAAEKPADDGAEQPPDPEPPPF
jgi:hypothetical protein